MEEDSGRQDFTVDNDQKAEWAIRAIAGDEAEYDRLIKICADQIAMYQEQIKAYEKRKSTKTAYLRDQLKYYFDNVPHHRSTKTQDIYDLPSGALRLVHKGPEYEYDNTDLTEYLGKHGSDYFIKTKLVPQWGEFKKLLCAKGGKAINTQTGEIVECITVKERPPEFVIDTITKKGV